MLTFLEDDITAHQGVPLEKAAAALAQIRFDLGLIHRFQDFIRLDLESLKDPDWQSGSPSLDASGSGTSETLAKTMYKSLITDYESLIQRCERLSKRCESSSNLLQSAIALLEAQKSIQQTTEVNKLTKLAFVILPLSLISSVFGMNVAEINPGSKPSIWQYVVASVVTLLPFIYIILGEEVRQRLRFSVPFLIPATRNPVREPAS